MSVAESMMIATGVTAIATIGAHVETEVLGPADPRATAKRVGTVVVAGALATGLLLVAERPAPELTRAFAGLVLITSLLVNGVSLFDTIGRLAGIENATAPPSPPGTIPTPPQSETVPS
jgi:hypothetical protein